MDTLVYYAGVKRLDENIEGEIERARRTSMDGSTVTYDLTSGVDFSKPRRTGEALAKVLFEQDISKWISIKDNDLVVKPSAKLVIRITEEHNRAVEKTIDDFRKDVKNDELKIHYSQQIESAANYQAGIASYMFLGVGTTLLIQHMQRSSQKSEYLGNVMSQIMASISVTTV